MSGLLRIFTFTALCNLLLLLGLGYCLDWDKRAPVILGSSDEFVFLSSTNHLGIRTVISFKNWKELQMELSRRQLQFPVFTYAEKRNPHPIRFSPMTSDTGANLYSYKLVWDKKVMHTPDVMCGLAFFEMLQMNRVQPSPVGFTVALQDETP